MKGYIEHKPGLPHYNYPARVLIDFMGYVFEVPPEVFAMRSGATASSTVDPKSICFTCHQLLTPLALPAAAAGRTTARTAPPTRTAGPSTTRDRGLVAAYPVQGTGAWRRSPPRR